MRYKLVKTENIPHDKDLLNPLCYACCFNILPSGCSRGNRVPVCCSRGGLYYHYIINELNTNIRIL
jgi:hypothetical protein